MVFNPSAGADEALGPFSFFRIINILFICQLSADFYLQITFYKQMSPGVHFFSESLNFSPTAHFLQDFHLNDILKVFPIQMH